jgi:hypothetical protein
MQSVAGQDVGREGVDQRLQRRGSRPDAPTQPHRVEVSSIMVERPGWAEKIGVPLAAKAWVGKRYRK